MSRALRLVVTRSKCERLVIPNILHSYLKIHGVSAAKFFTKKSYGVRGRVENKCQLDMSKVKNLAEANSTFGPNADAKVVFSKMLYRSV